jgi:hypothetical protein
MSQKVDEFCENLRVKLTGMETRLNGLKAKVEHDREGTKAAIDERIDEARTAIHSTKDDARAARERMAAQLEDKKTETEDKVAEWKHNREVSKLEGRAEDLEAYASWAILVAVDALDEADFATLRAIQARLDADYAAAV